ncbi:MAG: HEAT repeat domain-containing protein [Vampirovibrionia bacterium]
MFKSSPIVSLLTCLFVVMLAAGCNQNQQQVAPTAPVQAQQEGEAPDYTAIRKALKDPSPLVRSQAVLNLAEFKHSSVIDEYLQALQDNIDDKDVYNLCIKGIKAQGESAIPKVKETLWNNKSLTLQKVGLDILSQIEKPENFYADVVNRYYETPFESGASRYRQAMVQYIANNTAKDNLEAIADMVVMLKDKDSKIVQIVTKALSAFQSKDIQEQIVSVYESDPDNQNVVLAVLTVLNSYGVPTEQNPVPVKDLKVYMSTFGSYDKDIQKQSYIGMRAFAYDDKDGQIMNFLKSFQNCDYDVVRSNVVELLQIVPKNTYPEGQEPMFSFPKGKRQGYCH